MKKLRLLGLLTLALTFATSSIQGQDSYYQEDGCYSSAYAQSANTAHWSVYIPIAILVGAAIWFGLADNHQARHDSSDSQDGLGSIASSKRISHSSSGSRSSDSYPSKVNSSYSPRLSKSDYSNYSSYSRARAMISH